MATRALTWDEARRLDRETQEIVLRRPSALVTFVLGVVALFRFYFDHYLHAD